MNQTQAFIAMLKQAQFLLIAGGAVMVHLGMDHTESYKVVMVAAGSVTVVGTAAWGLYSSFRNFQMASTVGVNAALNLAASGNMVDTSGNPIMVKAAPKPATPQSAVQIVKDYSDGTG